MSQGVRTPTLSLPKRIPDNLSVRHPASRGSHAIHPIHMTNPISVKDAVEIHLEHREGEVTSETLQSTEYRLGHFIRWCKHEDVGKPSELGPQDMHRYRVWRRRDGNLAPASEKTQMDTLRVFIRWCETMQFVDPDLHTAVLSPSLSSSDKRRNDIVDSEKAEAILEHLEKYHYASRDHVLFLLAWHTAMRTSALRALDVEDFFPENKYVEVVNRPETGTRLKNGDNGERYIALASHVCMVIKDYVGNTRSPETDEYGRKALLSTKRSGRISKNTIRSSIYRSTRPCWYTDHCPHDKEPDSCRAVGNSYAYECPSSTAAHSVRRGSITHMLRNDTPEQVVADRANVSEDVLDAHYDKRTGKEKMEQRREFLRNI